MQSQYEVLGVRLLNVVVAEAVSVFEHLASKDETLRWIGDPTVDSLLEFLDRFTWRVNVAP